MYDFRNKASLETPTQIVGMDCDLQELADKMELSETRKNSTVARRYIVALPHEVSKEERAELSLGFLEHLHKEYGVAGAVSVHEPDRGGDGRNYHAHITISDREVSEQGEFGKKVRVLTDLKTRNVELEKIKEHWESRCNEVLEAQGKKKVKEKSLVPGVHQGREATEMMRKKGHSYKIEAERWNAVCKKMSVEQKALGRKEETYEELVRRVIGDDVEISQEKKEQWEAGRRGEDYDDKGITTAEGSIGIRSESEAQQDRVEATQRDVVLDGGESRERRRKEPIFGTPEYWIQDADRLAKEIIGVCREGLEKLRELQSEISGALREFGGQSYEQRHPRRAEARRSRGVSEAPQEASRELEKYKYDHDGKTYTDDGKRMPEWRAFERMEAVKKYPKSAERWNPKALEKAQKELKEKDFGMER